MDKQSLLEELVEDEDLDYLLEDDYEDKDEDEDII